jgi:type IV pilus assembly protein PilV
MQQLVTNPPRQAGFTILEVLVAALMLGIGLVGILGLQATATVTNRRASEMRAAMQVAQTQLERAKLDAVEWTAAGAPANTTTLGQVLGSMPAAETGTETDPGTVQDYSSEEGWTFRNNAGVVATVNELGLEFISDTTLANGRRPQAMTTGSDYCVATRAFPLLDNEMIRLDVRVFWPKNTAGEAAMAGSCDWFGQARTEADYDTRFHSVRLTGTVRRNEQGGAAVLPPTT